MRRLFTYITLLVLFSGQLSVAVAEELVTITTRPAIKQTFLYDKHPAPLASVILFPGNNGYLKMQKKGVAGIRSTNFLVRTRAMYKAAGFSVAVFEAPSDHQGSDGMFGGFRYSDEHAEDIAGVVRYLRRQAEAPVWLIGTSRGTESAANAALRRPSLPDGIVLTASMSVENGKGYALPEMELNKIKVPVMLVGHKDDECWVTPADGMQEIKKALVNARRVEVKTVRGGRPPDSLECAGLSAHGFYGIEAEVVDMITAFIHRHIR